MRGRSGQLKAMRKALADEERRLDNGYEITAIGGGTGLSTILRGLKEVTSHINAIVTVTDNGGSSGRLLQGNTVTPPGDIRNCLAALSPQESILKKMLDYRFSEPPELKGHSLGNLMLAGLDDLTGDMATAIRDISEILNIRGDVIPVTLDDICLGAVMDDEEIVMGETSVVDDERRIKKVFLEPGDSSVNPDAVEAILGADIVLLGPGSLYTSVIPNLLVPGIMDALISTEAPVVYVANIMTQKGETEGYNLSDHIEALLNLSNKPFLNGVIVNSAPIAFSPAVIASYKKGGLSGVICDDRAIRSYNLKVWELPLAKEDGTIMHDASVLADFVASGQWR